MLCLTFNHWLALTSFPRTQNCTVKHTANNLWQFTANHKTAGCWHIVTGLADIIPPHQVVWNCTKSLRYFHNRILLVPAFKPKCLWRLWHKASTTFRFPFTISENKTIMTFQKKYYDVEVQYLTIPDMAIDFVLRILSNISNIISNMKDRVS